MTIRKTHKLLALLLCAVGFNAYAVDGVITIKGNISDTTCAVSVNNNGKNATVTLPNVSASALPTAGTTAGDTTFTINLSSCSSTTAQHAHTFFEPGNLVDANSGRLKTLQPAGAATNIQVELLNAQFQPIIAGALTQNDIPVDISSGSGVLHYGARYYATAAAEAGTVETNVEYTIIYD